MSRKKERDAMTVKDYNQELKQKGLRLVLCPIAEISVEDLHDDTEAEIRHKFKIFRGDTGDTPKDGEYTLTLTAPQLSYILRSMEMYSHIAADVYREELERDIEQVIRAMAERGETQ